MTGKTKIGGDSSRTALDTCFLSDGGGDGKRMNRRSVP
jgi:hypothetical protein